MTSRQLRLGDVVQNPAHMDILAAYVGTASTRVGPLPKWCVLQALGGMWTSVEPWLPDREAIVGHVADMLCSGLQALTSGGAAMVSTRKLIGVDSSGCYVNEGDWLRDIESHYVMRAERFNVATGEFLCGWGGVYAIQQDRAAPFVPGSLHVSEHDICPYDREAYAAALRGPDAAVAPSRRAAGEQTDVFDNLEQWL